MRKKAILFVNTVAGTGEGRKNFGDVLERLADIGYETVTYLVHPGINFTVEEVLQENHDYDLVVCCGGDGTLNRTINALMNNDLKIPIAYLPLGSTNDFARSLGFKPGQTLDDYCEELLHGEPFTYDLGKINGIYFNYVAAFGAFTDTSYSTDQNIKNILGYGAYIIQAITTLPKNLNYKIKAKINTENIVLDDEFIFGAISNTLSMGGVTIPYWSESKLDDGYFEVLLIKSVNNIGDMNNIITSLLSGKDDPNVIAIKTKHIFFEFEDDVVWTIDGEDSEPWRKADIDVIDGAITIRKPGK